jgi:hypothetical protein
MKQVIADAFVLAIIIALICGGVALCSRDPVITGEGDVRCNRLALDRLNGGVSPDDVIAEHALCIRSER